MSKATFNSDPRLRVSRRGFMKASGVSAAMAATASIGAIPFVQSAAAQQGWDAEFDVVVAGSGNAAFAAAITAKANGADVVMYEKGAYVGGTTLVSGGGGWFPNNHLMQTDGIEDPKEEAIMYMTRYSLPHLYNPDDPQYGLSDDDYALFSTYYDTSSIAPAFFEELGAIAWIYGQGFGPHFDKLQVDYMEEYEENLAPTNRTLHPQNADGGVGRGADMIGGYQAWAEVNDIGIHLNHRVENVVINSAGEVIGVEVSVGSDSGTPEASPVPAERIAIRARKGVVFGSGGFARNADMMRHLMDYPRYGGCSAPTNEGDLLRISAALGAKLGNLHNTWGNDGLFEQAVADTGAYNCIFLPYGDSFIQVNKTGRRFMNEKRNYQDRPRSRNDWDSNYGDWTSRLSFYVYDQRTQDNWGGMFPFPEDATTAPYVITGNTLEELADAIVERVEGLSAVTGKIVFDPNFRENLVAEVEKFNGFAAAGEDQDFLRGSLRYDVEIPFGPMSATANLTEYPSPDQPNSAMYPISADGPYYAFIVAASAVDTNGGPVINPNAQVVRWDGTAIEGLYGAGNCIANPSVNAYWGGGATIGNGHIWGYTAGKHAAAAPEKSVD